jgi:hypothetical protein
MARCAAEDILGQFIVPNEALRAFAALKRFRYKGAVFEQRRRRVRGQADMPVRPFVDRQPTHRAIDRCIPAMPDGDNGGGQALSRGTTTVCRETDRARE